jgi:methionyl aminopeptidase
MAIKLKSNQEIAIMKEGGQRHALILRMLAAMVKPGVTTLDLEHEARRLVAEGGDSPSHLGYTPRGADRPFPAVLCVSINDEIVHGIPNENVRTLVSGDIVTIDLSITHGGLITDSAVTVAVGEVSKEARHLLSTTKSALEAGILAASPGGHIGDIGQAIGAVVGSAGLFVARDLAGHGVGYNVHEDPYVPNTGRRGEGEKIEPGLVISIEPMVCVGTDQIKVLPDGYTISTTDGSLSAHFEHTVAITEKGNIILTL